MRLPRLFCIRKFVIYDSCAGLVLPLHLNHICVGIDMFGHHITMSELIYLCILYNLIFGCTSSWVFFLYWLLNHCVSVTSMFVLICLWILYICLLQYVWVLHKIYSLVVPYIGNIFMHIYCILFFIPLLPYSLTCIHKSGLTPCCFN